VDGLGSKWEDGAKAMVKVQGKAMVKVQGKALASV